MTRTSNKASRKCFTPKRKSPNYGLLKKNCGCSKTNNRKRRNRTIKEIAFYQKTTNLLINRLPFLRVVKQVLDELRPTFGYRWQEKAVEALQEMAEVYLISLFEDANYVANNAKRVTIKVEDLHVVRRIRGISDIGNH